MQGTTIPVERLSIAGEEYSSPDTVTVTAPWDGEPLGAVPMAGKEEALAAIAAAGAAMRAGLPAHQRALILDRAAGIIRARRPELGKLLALEAGKPIQQALVEIDRGIQTLTFSAAEARTLSGRGIPMDAHPSGTGYLGFTLRVPIGVVGAITPFNYPFNLAAHKIGPAIAAGCGVVVKPALKAPLTAIRLVNILHEAGLPKEWLSVITGPSDQIADVLVSDPRVGLITFTGSSEIGWSLAARAPQKRMTLELGNSTPLIVCADADLTAAAQAAASSGFAFAGQSCISVQRVLVDEQVHEDFVERLLAAAGRQRLGPPLDEQTTVGPLITTEARDRVSEWIEEARDAGAKRLGEDRISDGHLSPVVLDEIPTGVRAWNREIFGPVLGVRAFSGLDEAIELANDTDYGLQAGIFTTDLDASLRAAQRLEFGGVTINETPTFRVDQMPYGGTKNSGNTREGPHFTVREMTEERMVVIRTGAR